MVKFIEKLKQDLEANGMPANHADAVVTRLIATDPGGPMHDRYNNSVEDYPSSVYKVLWITCKAFALEYIDEVCPGVWFRQMFVPHKEREKFLVNKGFIDEVSSTTDTDIIPSMRLICDLSSRMINWHDILDFRQVVGRATKLRETILVDSLFNADTCPWKIITLPGLAGDYDGDQCWHVGKISLQRNKGKPKRVVKHQSMNAKRRNKWIK